MFVRERERPEPVEKLMPALAALYQKAAWRSVSVPHVASDAKRYAVSQPHAEIH